MSYIAKGQKKFQKTIPIDNNTNTFSFYTTSGVRKYLSHALQMEKTQNLWFSEQCIVCNKAIKPHSQQNLFTFDEYNEEEMSTVKNTTTYKNNMKLYDEAYENMHPNNMNKEFIRRHYRLWHISF